MSYKYLKVFDATAAGGAAGAPSEEPEAEKQTEQEQSAQEELDEFETWLATQSDNVKKHYAAHVAGLKNALVAERTGNKEGRKKLQAFEAAEDARKKAAMTELERAKTEAQESSAKLTATQAELNVIKLRTAVEREAVKLGYADPEDAYKLLDTSALVLDDKGVVEGLSEALKNLAKTKPYLLTPQKAAAVEKGKGLGTDTGPKKKVPEGKEGQTAKIPLVHL